MDPTLIGAGAGAGLGVLKYYLEDLPNEQASRRIEEKATRWSPWTKINPRDYKHSTSSMIGNVMSGAGAGAAMGQSMAGGKPSGGSAQAGGMGQVAAADPSAAAGDAGAAAGDLGGGAGGLAAAGGGIPIAAAAPMQSGSPWSLMGNQKLPDYSQDLATLYSNRR